MPKSRSQKQEVQQANMTGAIPPQPKARDSGVRPPQPQGKSTRDEPPMKRLPGDVAPPRRPDVTFHGPIEKGNISREEWIRDETERLKLDPRGPVLTPSWSRPGKFKRKNLKEL